VSLLPCSKCNTHCDPCVRGKQCRVPFPPSSKEPSRILHRVHADTVGALPTMAVGGERYFLTVVEELSNFCEVVPSSLKGQYCCRV
jgi:hypothetical protein